MTVSRRIACAVSAAAAAGALLAVGAPSAVARTAATAAPRAALTQLSCRSTLAPADRRVSVVSVMRPVAHTRTLSVRFSLIEQVPGMGTRTVTDGDLGRWITPADPTLGRRAADVWKLSKVVYGIDAPARYRFRVQFRWLGADGRVLARATRTTAPCQERERRPDLLVRRVLVSRVVGHPRRDRYVAVIANRGLTASGPFAVLFVPPAPAPAQSSPLTGLGPGRSARVSFTGPVCDSTAPPSVVADPADAVDDFNRANNTLTVTCPGPSAANARLGAAPGAH